MPDFEMPAGYRDPIAAEGLPHITVYDPEAEDPTPPADRLDNEPADVTAEEH